MADPRIVVVGAGPAGMRAALTLSAHGQRPIVADEAQQSGGQIYRRQPSGFSRDHATLYGSDAHKAKALHDAFDAARDAMDYRPQTLVWACEPGRLRITQNGMSDEIAYDRLILATGATDRVMPLPGWTLPGVYTLGAAQVALKAQGCMIGSDTVFVGTGPLLYLVAYQYLKAGGTPRAVLDTATLRHRLSGLPGMMRRPGVLRAGLGYLMALRRAGVTVETGITPRAIRAGKESAVVGIAYDDQEGRQRMITCDAVALGYHLRAETQLADLAKCAFDFDPRTRQWLPRVDAMGRSTVPGVYLAGDGVRILGADGAEVAGQLAAHAVLDDLGHAREQNETRRLLRSLDTHRTFAAGLARAFPWPHALVETLPEDTIICRCEAVRVRDLREAVSSAGAEEVNRVKAFSRLGMGRCQGRYCALAGQELTGRLAGIPVEETGRLRGQAPVKPLAI